MKPQLLSEKQVQPRRGTLTDELSYFLNISGGKAKNTEIYQWLILGRPDITDKPGWKQVVSQMLRKIATATDKKMHFGSGWSCTWVLKSRLPVPEQTREISEAPQEPITINAPTFDLEKSPVKVHRRIRSFGPIESPKMINVDDIPGRKRNSVYARLAKYIEVLPKGKAYVFPREQASSYSAAYYRLKREGKMPKGMAFLMKDVDKPSRTGYLMNLKGE